MRTPKRTSFFMLVLLAAAAACVMPNITITDPLLQATLQALTVEAAVRATQDAASTASTGTPAVPPTASMTASLTNSPTATPVPSLTSTATLSPTAVVIPSQTAVVPLISVSVPTNCRAGPGKDYTIEGALLVGEIAQIVARDPSGNYWQIPNPDSPGDFCWVWDGYAAFSGYTGGLPMYTPPPTPTATMTATPSPSFDPSYDGLVWCTSTWWAEIALENTGPLTFRSVEITIRDVDLDISVSDEADGFFDRPDCSSSTSKVSLQPGKTVTISSPSLDNDPSGHRIRATITLCSKTGQEGQCVTETFRFTP